MGDAIRDAPVRGTPNEAANAARSVYPKSEATQGGDLMKLQVHVAKDLRNGLQEYGLQDNGSQEYGFQDNDPQIWGGGYGNP